MGVAVGDYDNDGFPDLLVLGYGRSILYHNEGDGTFTDVSKKSGVENKGRWASSAAWFDYGNDGRLDLVIANYVDWTPETNHYCGDKGAGMRSYCHPDVYHGQAPTLYHNNGDGTFTDVSKASGLGAKPGNGLGVLTFDYDNDGWQDIFIANDNMPNFLFHNNRDGAFTETAYLAGVAVSGDGYSEAGMGVDAADTTGSGRMDVIVTHLDQQLDRLYRNLGEMGFEDATFRSKLSYATFKFSGFGTCFLDYDNDGWRDLFIANGHVLDNVEKYRPDVTYAEPKLMLRNTGGGIHSREVQEDRDSNDADNGKCPDSAFRRVHDAHSIHGAGAVGASAPPAQSSSSPAALHGRQTSEDSNRPDREVRCQDPGREGNERPLAAEAAGKFGNAETCVMTCCPMRGAFSP
jgi:hypothetical protein